MMAVLTAMVVVAAVTPMVAVYGKWDGGDFSEDGGNDDGIYGGDGDGGDDGGDGDGGDDGKRAWWW